MAHIHQWTGFQSFSECEHEPLTDEQCIVRDCLEAKAPKGCLSLCQFCSNRRVGGLPWHHGQEAPSESPALFLRNDITNTAARNDKFWASLKTNFIRITSTSEAETSVSS